MDVMIVPPNPPEWKDYLIMRMALPTGRICDKDGEFLEFQEWFWEHRAIHFATIKEAITFANSHGWNIVNKIDDVSIFVAQNKFHD